MTQKIEMGQVNGLQAAIDAIQPQVQAARGQINGLKISYNVTNPTTHIDIAVGKCRSSDDSIDLNLTSPITKRLDQSYAAGTGNGGREAGLALWPNMGYHVYLIYNPTTLAYDAIFSLSATNPALPSGFTKYRRLGAFMTDASSNIRKFFQKGNWFFFKDRSTEFSNTNNNGPNVPYLRQLYIPQGKKMLARIYYQSAGTSDMNAYLSNCFDPDDGSPTSLDATTKWAHIRRYTVSIPSGSGTTFTSYGATVLDVWTDQNRQIYTMSNDATDTIAGGTVGWMDDRNELD